MNPTETDRVSDPLFQLNVVLWLTQPLPQGSSIVPLLHERGFVVYAISPPLPVPLDLQAAAQSARVALQNSGRPDVLLAHPLERKFAFIECKASSFGPNSNTAEQARSFLLMAGPRAAEVLGLDPAHVRGSLLAYLVPAGQTSALRTTLEQLQRDLNDFQMPAGNFSVVGLEMAALEVRLIVDGQGSAFLSLASGSHVIIRFQPETDPRPLYFIPYDPDVTYPSETERLFCKRILFERIHSSVLVAAGRSNTPADILLSVNDLLNDAMFGMYALWENRDSAQHMRGLCKQLLQAITRAVNGEVPQAISYDPERGWKVALITDEHRQKVIDALTRFSCETMNLKAPPEEDLFDRP